MRTLRRLRAQAPRQVRRIAGRPFGDPPTDATIEPHPEPPPEAVFDRLTGPFGSRRDEET